MAGITKYIPYWNNFFDNDDTDDHDTDDHDTDDHDTDNHDTDDHDTDEHDTDTITRDYLITNNTDIVDEYMTQNILLSDKNKRSAYDNPMPTFRSSGRRGSSRSANGSSSSSSSRRTVYAVSSPNY